MLLILTDTVFSVFYQVLQHKWKVCDNATGCHLTVLIL